MHPQYWKSENNLYPNKSETQLPAGSRESLIKAETSDRYFPYSCVGATFGNIVNLEHIHDFPQVTPSVCRITCYDENIHLIRASLVLSYFSGNESLVLYLLQVDGVLALFINATLVSSWMENKVGGWLLGDS